MRREDLGAETQCMACIRRGNRVIYWSFQECHECANRREEARQIREQRRAERSPLHSFVEGLGDVSRAQVKLYKAGLI